MWTWDIILSFIFYETSDIYIHTSAYIVMSNGKSSCIKIFTHDKHKL